MRLLVAAFLPLLILAKDYDGPTMQKPCKCSSDYESCIKSSDLEKPDLDSKDEEQLKEEAECMKDCLSDDLGNLVNCVYSDEAVGLQNDIEQCRQKVYDELPVENLGCKTDDYDDIKPDVNYNTQPLSFMSQESVFDCTMKCLGSVTYTSGGGSFMHSSHSSFSSSGNGGGSFSSSSSHGGRASSSSSSGPSSSGSSSSSGRSSSSSHSSSGGGGFKITKLPSGSSSSSFSSSSAGPGRSSHSSSHHSSGSSSSIKVVNGQIVEQTGNSWGNRAKRDTIFVDGGIIIQGDRITGPKAIVDGDRVTGPNTSLSSDGFVGSTAVTGPFDSETLIDCARDSDCYPVPPKVAGCNAEIKKYNDKVKQCLNNGK